MVPDEKVNPTTSPDDPGRQLVLVFSRAGENYNVGTVETGNTMVIAQNDREEAKADVDAWLNAIGWST